MVVEEYYKCGCIYYLYMDIWLCKVLLQKLAWEFSRISAVYYPYNEKKERGSPHLSGLKAHVCSIPQKQNWICQLNVVTTGSLSEGFPNAGYLYL